MARTKSTKTAICRVCGNQFIDYNYKGRVHCGMACSRVARVLPLATRFRSYVGETTETGCILWTGSIVNFGYGQIGAGGRKGGVRYAHRVAWELANGPIPDRLFVLHRCDVPSCVNVEHLFLGTHADNMADMAAKGRQLKGRDITGVKLTEAQVRAIRLRYASGGVSQKQVSRENGVAQGVISALINRKTWKHVT